MRYEVEFRDHDGSIFATAKVVADNDDQATARAEMLLRCGLGDCCEVRRDNQPVPVEQVLRDQQRCWALTQKCIDMALKTSNLQQRRLLMLLTETFLNGPPGGSELAVYNAVLIAATDAPIATIKLEAENDREAFCLASILANVCNARCVRFELWHGRTLRCAGIKPFLKQAAAGLPERLQRQAVAGEVALHEICKTAAESRSLLTKVDRWIKSASMLRESQPHLE